MRVLNTDLSGVMRIELESFSDHRGKYTETYNEDAYKRAGIDVHFIQDDISFSKKNVLRGIHGDQETYKLVSCLHGSFVLIVVNNDSESEEYKKWITFNLSGDDEIQILIPPKSEMVILLRVMMQYFTTNKIHTIIQKDNLR